MERTKRKSRLAKLDFGKAEINRASLASCY